MRIFVLLVLVLVIACARKKQPAADHSADTASVSVPAIGNSNPITIDEMIGIWQDSPEIASGYSDHYIFYSNGNFSFNYNQMVCDNRTIRYSGTWTLRRNTLQLTASDKTVIVGASLYRQGRQARARLITTLKEARKKQ